MKNGLGTMNVSYLNNIISRLNSANSFFVRWQCTIFCAKLKKCSVNNFPMQLTVNTIERDTEQETSFCLLPDVDHVLVRSMVQWTALTIVMTISYTNCLSVYKVLNLIKIFNWFWAQNKQTVWTFEQGKR